MFDSVVTYNFPALIRFGQGAVKELAPHLKQQNLKRPLFVTDKNLSQLGFFKAIIKDLEQQGLDVKTYCEISKNPVKSDVHRGAEYFNQESRDSIIGIGGGALIAAERGTAG